MSRVHPSGELLAIDPAAPDADTLARAAALLRSGRLVAFPTETVYGLGAHALDPDAVARIFAAKGRPVHNPLIVHVADVAEARRLAASWPPVADRLAAAFWPGPLTLVVPRAEQVPDIVTAGLPSVAVRVPAHPVALALLEAAGIPVAAPSANRSTAVSPTRAEHVAASLGDRVDLILDAGPTSVGIESTVVDLTGERPTVLRPGMVSAEDIAAVVGPVTRAGSEVTVEGPRASPGLDRRHYAPRAELVVVDPADLETAATLARAAGHRVAAIVRTATIPEHAAYTIALENTPDAFARRLYDSLHALDAAGYTYILIERLPGTPEWEALRDRLARAAYRM